MENINKNFDTSDLFKFYSAEDLKNTDIDDEISNNDTTENDVIHDDATENLKRKISFDYSSFNEKTGCGIVNSYDENNKLVSKKNYLNFKEDGIQETYFPNGTMKKTPYENGVIHGDELTFNKNNLIIIKTPYENGVINGIEEHFYENGALAQKTTFKDGLKHGLETKYYENGNLLSETPFLKNKKHGIEKFFDEKGELIKTNKFYYGKKDDKNKNERLDPLETSSITQYYVNLLVMLLKELKKFLNLIDAEKILKNFINNKDNINTSHTKKEEQFFGLVKKLYKDGNFDEKDLYNSISKKMKKTETDFFNKVSSILGEDDFKIFKETIEKVKKDNVFDLNKIMDELKSFLEEKVKEKKADSEDTNNIDIAKVVKTVKKMKI